MMISGVPGGHFILTAGGKLKAPGKMTMKEQI